MSFAQIDGGQLYFRSVAAAHRPMILFSNSLGTDLELWDLQVAALATSFGYVRYDSRGHGRSVVTPGPYNIEQLGRDVLKLMDHLQIEKTHFCGLSLGGMVGMWLAAHAPDRVDKLVLANTTALMGPREAWDARISAVQQGGMVAISDAVIERWLTPAFRASSDRAKLLRAMLEATPPEGYCANCAAIRDMDQRASLGQIQAPTLVIAGTHDPATPPAMGRAIADAIPNAQYQELSAAHLSNIEAAAAFNQAVAGFLLGERSIRDG